ncbi:hypothetical protein [Chlorobaculum sp. 24CR]|uniref:hypothetical protein n=1 Tax=Chlorobaculum sp. 24CR TaxID=2508878 RepID=UPI001430C363|nr:hypothetical protein [Chlorobaculum sp. 24CR]
MLVMDENVLSAELSIIREPEVTGEKAAQPAKLTKANAVLRIWQVKSAASPQKKELLLRLKRITVFRQSLKLVTCSKEQHVDAQNEMPEFQQ